MGSQGGGGGGGVVIRLGIWMRQVGWGSGEEIPSYL